MTPIERYDAAHKAYRLRYVGNCRKTAKELRDAMTEILKGK